MVNVAVVQEIVLDSQIIGLYFKDADSRRILAKLDIVEERDFFFFLCF